MVNLKNRFMAQLQAVIRRLIKFEICAVDKVHWHKSPFPGDKDFNVCDVVIRDRRKIDDPDFHYIRHRIPSLQTFIGHLTGFPWNPRRGNLVKVLFYKQRKGLILSPILSKWEEPICRPDPYSIRQKYTQYRPLSQNKYKDFDKEFPPPLKPKCDHWWHGKCYGDIRDDAREPTLGRDFHIVFDYCKEGNAQPHCADCKTIDYPGRSENTWLKVYSHNTESCISPPKRVELHNYCGSFLRFENEQGYSVEYSEGKGHIRLGNAISEKQLKGHLNFHPTGSIDIHTKHEASEQDQATYGSIGNQVIVVADDHTVKDENGNDVAARMINFDKKSYVEILKNGKIIIKSGEQTAIVTIDGINNKVTISGTEDVEITASNIIECTAATKMIINAPILETNCATKVQHNTPCIYQYTRTIHGDETCPGGGEPSPGGDTGMDLITW